MIAWLTLTLLLFAAPAWGAVSVVAAVALHPASSEVLGGSKAATATITPSGTNKVLVVTVNLSEQSCANPASTVTAVTDDQAQSYTLITPFKMREGVLTCSAGQWRGEQAVAYTINPANVATTVSVTITVVSPVELAFGGVVYNGADQTTPITNVTSLYQDAGSSTITRSVSSASGNMVSDLVCNGSAIPTPGNSQDARWDSGTDLLSDCGSTVTGTVAGASSFSDTWNVDSGDTSSITAFNVVAADASAADTSLPTRTLLGVGQ